MSRSPARLVQSLGLCFDPLLKCLKRFIVLLPDAAPSRPGLLDGSPGTRSAMLLPGWTSCVARRWSPIKRRARRMWKLTCGSGCRRSECGIRIGRGTRGL